MSEKKKLRCRKCAYRAEPNKPWLCNYEGVTGHTRKAQPPEECTYFIAGDRIVDGHQAPVEFRMNEVKRRGKAPPEKYDWSKAKKLYDKGMNDGEISRELGYPLPTVKSWRRRKNLPSNAGSGRVWKKENGKK